MSKKKHVKSEFGTVVAPFYKMGQLTCRFLKKIKFFQDYFDKLADKLKIIYPKYRREEILENYISYKLMSVYMFAFTGILVLCTYNALMSEKTNITELKRPDYWSQDETVQILAKTEEGEDKIDITVSHQNMPDDEMKKLIEKKAEQLPELILGNNVSIDNVSDNLELISEIPDTQINVYWSLEENEVLLSDGTLIKEKISQDGNMVKLRASLSYEDIMADTEFYVNIVQADLTEKEKAIAEITEKIKIADEDGTDENVLVLPENVNGNKVSYFLEEDAKKTGWVVLLFAVGIVLLFFVQDEKLEKQKKKRENQMMMDYPEIINKLVIYIGAGLTIQGAFEMISENYSNDKKNRKSEKRFAYEEIVYLCREIQGGVSFRTGLEHFSVRCNIMPFRKLSMLLLQNLKKGSNELLIILRNEAVVAFEARKNTAKKLGEEAETKILLPMLMMLGIVLIILIVPACMTFEF